MKKPAQRLIAEVPRRHAEVEMTIGIDLGDVWSHYCTLNPEGAVVDRGRFRTTAKATEKWFTNLPPARIAMETGNALDLDQRAAAGVRTGSHRGQRARAADDLT
jgi:transposase